VLALSLKISNDNDWLQGWGRMAMVQ